MCGAGDEEIEIMKIIQLTAENVKKLKVVDITPRGPMVRVTSRKNGQGKTSVLDSIWWLLTNAKNVQAVPIRKGAEEARIRGVLGGESAEYIVERKFLASGTTTVTVRDARGSAPGTPDKKLPKWGDSREILDGLIGDLSFDPLAFAREKPKEQYEHLRSIAKLDVDLDALKVQNDADFKRRTDLNRDAKIARAQVAAFVIPADTPAQRIDESDILNRIQASGEHNASIETRRARREQTQRDANDKKAEGVRLRERSAQTRQQTADRVADLQRQIECLKKDGEEAAQQYDQQASAALKAAADLEEKIDSAPALPAPIIVTELRAELEAAKTVNADVSKREQRDAIAAAAADLEAQAKELTDRMEAREKTKVEAIKAAKMPVEGLGFGDGFVTYHGLPFDQASDGECLRVSAEIAMNENPKLRVIRIRDGSLLDDDNLAILAQMATERDYQIWIEQVDKSGTVGIVMEDGEIVADNQTAEPEKVSA